MHAPLSSTIDDDSVKECWYSAPMCVNLLRPYMDGIYCFQVPIKHEFDLVENWNWVEGYQCICRTSMQPLAWISRIIDMCDVIFQSVPEISSTISGFNDFEWYSLKSGVLSHLYNIHRRMWWSKRFHLVCHMPLVSHRLFLLLNEICMLSNLLLVLQPHSHLKAIPSPYWRHDILPLETRWTQWGWNCLHIPLLLLSV